MENRRTKLLYRLDRVQAPLNIVNQIVGRLKREEKETESRVIIHTLLIAWTRSRQIYHSKSSDSKKFRLEPG